MIRSQVLRSYIIESFLRSNHGIEVSGTTSRMEGQRTQKKREGSDHKLQNLKDSLRWYLKLRLAQALGLSLCFAPPT